MSLRVKRKLRTTGKGRSIRVLPQKQLEETVVRYYINQAIALNAKK